MGRKREREMILFNSVDAESLRFKYKAAEESDTHTHTQTSL